MSRIAIAEPVSTIRCEQALHHDLRARAVERADERQRQDAVPQRDDRRRELQHLLLLTVDDGLALLLEHLRRVQAERIQQDGRFPGFGGEGSGILGLVSDEREERLLQRKDEGRRLRG